MDIAILLILGNINDSKLNTKACSSLWCAIYNIIFILKLFFYRIIFLQNYFFTEFFFFIIINIYAQGITIRVCPTVHQVLSFLCIFYLFCVSLCIFSCGFHPYGLLKNKHQFCHGIIHIPFGQSTISFVYHRPMRSISFPACPICTHALYAHKQSLILVLTYIYGPVTESKIICKKASPHKQGLYESHWVNTYRPI